jgi:hypothetical protein
MGELWGEAIVKGAASSGERKLPMICPARSRLSKLLPVLQFVGAAIPDEPKPTAQQNTSGIPTAPKAEQAIRRFRTTR